MSAASPRFHRLTISDVRRETADAVSLAFAPPPGLAEAYRFDPGQYLTLRATVAGEDLRRSYSICSGPGEGLRVAVKRVPGGVFSSWIHETAQAGDEIDVMTPTGRFGLARHPGDGRVHVGFAAGSGVTPILSILKGVLSSEPASRFFLFYGNRSTADVLFRAELEAMKDQFLSRLSLFHVLSQEEQDISLLNGRLDGEKARLLLRSMIPAAMVDHFFLCGPNAMSEEIAAVLTDLGISEDQIHVERFVSGLGGKPRRAPPPPVILAAPAHRADLIVDGKRKQIPVAEGEAILDAALRAGLDLPYACKGGMCSTCRAKLVEGTAEMTLNYSLEPWEIKAGFILTCQAHPTSARIVIDYDAV